MRPHGKAHKSGHMAQVQKEAHKAFSGICAQKVTEAAAFINHGGVRDVYVSNEIVSTRKLTRLAQLAAKPEVRIRLCVDDAGNVQEINRIAKEHDVVFGLVVDVDVGQKRCGVSSPSAAVELAQVYYRHTVQCTLFLGVEILLVHFARTITLCILLILV